MSKFCKRLEDSVTGPEQKEARRDWTFRREGDKQEEVGMLVLNYGEGGGIRIGRKNRQK